MQPKNIRRGFTLIELLVVVLIIAILAAVAVPQYQKAVERSKAAEGLSMLKSINQAYDLYYLTNNAYATNFNLLDVTVPWSGNTKWNNSGKGTLSNNDWSIQLYQTSTWNVILMGRISGPYTGAGFGVIQKSTIAKIPLNTIVCMERISGGKNFNRDDGDYCSGVMHGSFLTQDSTARYYTYP